MNFSHAHKMITFSASILVIFMGITPGKPAIRTFIVPAC